MNPSPPITTIKFGVPEETTVSVSIYDLRGRKVEDIFLGQKNLGYHMTTWDASHYSSGIYFVRFISPHFNSIKKIMLVK